MSATRPEQTNLFLMRLWDDGNGGDDDIDTRAGSGGGASQSKWRGKLLHVTTGEAIYFSGWPGLLAILESRFPEATDGGQSFSAGPGRD